MKGTRFLGHRLAEGRKIVHAGHQFNLSDQRTKSGKVENGAK